MMAEKLRTALVGIGKVTDLHTKALVSLPESDFTAVCGRNPEKTGKYARRYGVKSYTDVSEMVSKEKIDVVKSRLIRSYGYCDVCATDILNFVASIFARGDVREES